MKPTPTLKTFLADETGAVTTDWVVITAGVMFLGLAAAAVVIGGVENNSNDIAQYLANTEPAEQPFVGNATLSASTDITAN